MAADPVIPVAVALTSGGIFVEYLGVPSAALVGAAMGSVIALHLTEPIEPRSRMWLAVFANFACGIYGGQLFVTYAIASMPITLACAICAAVGVKLIPWLLERFKALKGGSNV